MRYLPRNFSIVAIIGICLFLYSCSDSSTDVQPKKNNDNDNFVITSFTPSEASAGSIVNIWGSFSSNKSDITVKFGNKIATIIAATSDRLRVKVPKGLASDKVSVRVTIGSQTVVAPNKFTVINLNYASEYAYNVNVVYFSPSNVPPLPNYRERLSKILLNVQSFYGHWMEHWDMGIKHLAC